MGNLTLHLECTAGWERGKKFLEQSGVETAFLLNSNPDQVQHALNHTTGIVVVRVYDPFSEAAKYGENFEKEITIRHTPQEFVNWLNGRDLSRFKGNKRVRFILGWNEPSYGGRDYQKTLNEKMVAIADALVKAQYGGALFGLACDKSLQWEDIQAGIWQPFIDWLKANREWAHLDIHEYSLGRMASQHLKSYPVGYPASISDPVSMARSNWGVIDYKDESLRGKANYHLGRIAWLGGGFPYARGETGTDYKEDGAIRAWMPQFMAKFGKPEGFPSNRDLYVHLTGKFLSDREFCEAIYEDLTWFVEFDKADCLSNAIYADNQSPRWQPFNLGKPEYAYLYELLGKQAPMPTPIPPVVTIPFPALTSPLWENGTLTLGDSTNLRSQPTNTSNNVVKTLPAGSYKAKQFPETKLADGYTWYAYQVGVKEGEPYLNVWIARRATTTWQKEIVIPPPQVEREYFVDIPGGATSVMKQSVLDALIEYKRLELEGLRIIRNAPQVE